MNRADQIALARLSARLALRAMQRPATVRHLCVALDAQQIVNQTATNAPKLISLHRECLRAGIMECNHGEDVASASWQRIKTKGENLAPWLASLGLVLHMHSTDPRGPMLVLIQAPPDVAKGWPPLFDTDDHARTYWSIPC